MKPQVSKAMAGALLAAAATLTACQPKVQVETAPIEVKPIHITVDVNFRIQKELADFFSFENDVASASQPGATAPVASPQSAAATEPAVAPPPATTETTTQPMDGGSQ
jgi:hypothetical protein